MSIVFSRVDGRMIHGQVAIAWTRILQIDEILVVNNEAAQDETQKMLLEFATPSGINLSICSIDEAFETIKTTEANSNRTMVVYKNVQDAVDIVKKGIHINELNIGGMYFKEGKTKYEKALCVDEKDIHAFKFLNENGVNMFYQVAPMNEKEKLSKYINF